MIAEFLRKIWSPSPGEKSAPVTKILPVFNQGTRGHDGENVLILRRDRRGRPYIQSQYRLGPNTVHAYITHQDGSITDIGLSKNLLTNIGRDIWSGWTGGFIAAGATTASPATTVTTSAVTVTATPLTASHLTAAVQVGVSGMRIWFPVTGITTAPVYANCVSNTTSVITIDQWWKVDDTTGTTPANTNAFQLAPGGVGAIRFMGLTTDASAASAADVVLATEITNNGANRQLATYAHTFGANTLTLSKQFSITGTLTAIHKMGLFPCLPQGGTTEGLGGACFFETVLNADATVVNGDTLTVTDTITLAG